MNYIPSWLNDTYTLLQKLQKCIEKIENISIKEIPDAIKPIQNEINNIETDIASLKTDCAFVNKSNTFTKPQQILRDKTTTLGFAVQEKSGVGNEYDYTDYSHGHITKSKNNKRQIYTYNLPDKSGDVALKSDIPTNGVVNGQEYIYVGNGDPAQVKLHAGSSPSDAYIEIKGGSGAYSSRIYPMQQGPHTEVDYILPDTNNQSETPEEQHLLSDKNIKTVFGNSIYGSGDIKLYKHLINLSSANAGLDIYVNVYSHSNTPVNSVDSLKTLLGNYFKEIAYATKMDSGFFGYISESMVQLSNGTQNLSFYYGDSAYPLTISDYVTAI